MFTWTENVLWISCWFAFSELLELLRVRISYLWRRVHLRNSIILYICFMFISLECLEGGLVEPRLRGLPLFLINTTLSLLLSRLAFSSLISRHTIDIWWFKFLVISVFLSVHMLDRQTTAKEWRYLFRIDRVWFSSVLWKLILCYCIIIGLINCCFGFSW